MSSLSLQINRLHLHTRRISEKYNDLFIYCLFMTVNDQKKSFTAPYEHLLLTDVNESII